MLKLNDEKRGNAQEPLSAPSPREARAGRGLGRGAPHFSCGPLRQGMKISKRTQNEKCVSPCRQGRCSCFCVVWHGENEAKRTRSRRAREAGEADLRSSSLSDLGRRFFCGFAVIHYWRLYNGCDEFKKWLAGAGHYRSAGAPIKKRAGLVRPGPLPGIFRPDRPVSVPRPGGAAASDCRPGKPAAIPAPPFPRRAGEIAGSPARS